METLEARLAAEARRLREQASLLPPGAAREDRLRKARQAETGSRMSKWLRSPGLQSPQWIASARQYASSTPLLRGFGSPVVG
nr:hypothetical protein [Bradyrhizobium guangdongense]